MTTQQLLDSAVRLPDRTVWRTVIESPTRDGVILSADLYTDKEVFPEAFGVISRV